MCILCNLCHIYGTLSSDNAQYILIKGDTHTHTHTHTHTCAHIHAHIHAHLKEAIEQEIKTFLKMAEGGQEEWGGVFTMWSYLRQLGKAISSLLCPGGPP